MSAFYFKYYVLFFDKITGDINNGIWFKTFYLSDKRI